MRAISQKKVTTKKSHKCWGCGREFPKGTKMDVVTSVDDSQMMSVYWCDICIGIMDDWTNDERSDGCTEGELLIEYPEMFKPHNNER